MRSQSCVPAGRPARVWAAVALATTACTVPDPLTTPYLTGPPIGPRDHLLVRHVDEAREVCQPQRPLREEPNFGSYTDASEECQWYVLIDLLGLDVDRMPTDEVTGSFKDIVGAMYNLMSMDLGHPDDLAIWQAQDVHGVVRAPFIEETQRVAERYHYEETSAVLFDIVASMVERTEYMSGAEHMERFGMDVAASIAQDGTLHLTNGANYLNPWLSYTFVHEAFHRWLVRGHVTCVADSHPDIPHVHYRGIRACDDDWGGAHGMQLGFEGLTRVEYADDPLLAELWGLNRPLKMNPELYINPEFDPEHPPWDDD